MRHTLGSFKDIYASNLGHKEINTTLYSKCNQASEKTHDTGAIDVKMDGFFLEEKSFLRCRD